MKKFTIRLILLLAIWAQALINADGQISVSGNLVTGCSVSFSSQRVGTYYVWNLGNYAYPATDSINNNNTAFAVFSRPGTYMVTVKTSTTCCGLVFDTLSVTITQGSSNINATFSPDSICIGSSINIKASPGNYSSYAYLFNNQGPYSTFPGDSFTVSLCYPGDSITVLGYDNGCYTFPGVVIYPNFFAPTSRPLLIAYPGDTICGGDTLIFSTYSGYDSCAFFNGSSRQYLGPSNTWTTNHLGQNNSVSVYGYKNGCRSLISNLDTIIVYQRALTITSGNHGICPGQPDTVFLDGAYDQSYFYSNNNLVQSGSNNYYVIPPLSNGSDTITVRGTINGRCPSPPDTFVVTAYPIPSVTLSLGPQGDTFCLNTAIAIIVEDSNAHLIYINCNLEAIGPGSPYGYNNLITGLPTGTNKIWAVPNDNGCIGQPSDTLTIVVDSSAYCDSITSISNMNEANKKLRVYPNPTATTLHVVTDLSLLNPVCIQICSVTGQILHSERNVGSLSEHSIYVNDLADGIYYIVLSQEGKVVARQKFVKQ